jgi:serine protease Do
MGGNWDFNLDDERISLFSEDANRAMLGVVTDVDDKGAEITSISKESAAEKAGLKKGDIITKIGDKKVEDAEDVSEAIREHKPGDKVAVTILRDGKEQKITAELGKWKGVNMSTITPGRVYGNAIPRVMQTPDAPGASTFYFRGNTPRLGLSIQDTEDGKGVKVIDVDDEGNAAKAGVEEDDVITHVNDKEVNNADEIAKMIKENKDNASVRLKVLRDGKTKNIEVRIPKKLKTADL